MKKVILNLAIASVLLVVGCSKKSSNISPAECSQTVVTEYAAAITAWSADPTNTTKCKNVVSLLGKLINCPGVSSTDKVEYQKILADVPCK
jgi:uncharacterized protein YcfL